MDNRNSVEICNKLSSFKMQKATTRFIPHRFCNADKIEADIMERRVIP